MEMGVGPVFWILAGVIFISSIMVVSLKNIFHCALFLILCLFSIAGIYILLNAEFLAAAQVLIYVGAVSILIIFAIMLTSDLGSKQIIQTNKNAFIAFFVCLMFALAIIQVVRHSSVWQAAQAALPSENALAIGKLLMTKYMLPFEVVSVLMLAALIGAVVLAREENS